MRKIGLLLLTALVSQLTLLAREGEIFGKVVDERGEPLSFVNIYIENSIDGTSTLGDGTFRFTTNKQGEVVLIATLIGYKNYKLENNVSELRELTIELKEATEELEEVVVQVGNFVIKGTSSVEAKGSIDIATTAGSEGDLFKAISMLPGSQVAESDGRLLIRGGASNESQTYIDDMHVLSPYGATAPNHQARSRYSPFFFSGINFSMGGYSSEYSQSLSSVLPLYTKDEVKDSKYGVNLMNVQLGGGTT